MTSSSVADAQRELVRRTGAPAAKLAPPVLPMSTIDRPRLSRALTRAVRRAPLTVVRGPAGAGKTVLAARWAAEASARTPVAWLGLDPYDDDPVEFWAEALQALHAAGVLADQPLPLPLDGLPRGLVPELAGQLAARERPAVLVLDGADVLSDPAVVGGLDLLVRTAGRGLRLVLCSRAEPQLPLHRYRLAGTVEVIDQDRLRCTSDETRTLLGALGLPAGRDTAEALCAETRGWVTGIRLAAGPLSRAPTAADPAVSLAREGGAIAEYLSAEVIDPLPGPVRQLLLRAAVPDEPWPDLLADLSATPRPGGVLRSLVRAAAFVEETPGTAGGYRLHPLLRETLLGRLAAEQPDEVPGLHRRCAVWCAEHGRLPEAVEHALAAEDRDLVARLLLDGLAAPRWLAHGTDDLWDRTAGLLADREGPDGAVLRAAAAVADGRDPDPDDLAAAASGGSDGDRPRLRASAALTCLTEATRRGAGGSVDAAAVEPLIRALPSDEQRDAAAVLRVDAAVAALRSGESADRLRAGLRTAATAARVAGASAAQSLATADLAVLEALDGDLARALRSAAESDALADAGGGPLRSAAATAAGSALQQRFLLAAAAEWSARAGRRPGAATDATAPALAVLVSRTHRLHRDYDDASGPLRPWLREPGTPAWAREHVVGEAVRLAIARREYAEATALLDELGDGGRRARLAARIALSSGAAATPLSEEPDAGAGPTAQVEALLLRATWLLATGRERAAVESLLAALDRARDEVLRLPFFDAPPPARRALRTVPALRTAAAWLDPAARVPPRSAPRAGADPPAPATASAAVEELSARETEVLRHLADLLSTEEIAATMFVSVNTVRTHIRSILRKLGVARRNDAVRRARALGLL
ncbi:LuxR C-terminal-related transcriptional regulator [Amnibacterium kyonggiense]|uniref:LuxR family maltose regulon positive regulatory protein n=1 Tax=Amnibacterium kyonggiense TaxID=595671 RepID=A0A4R7FPB2_9MICO|nr:LuxR C-terminal-related transcriptional regulator [Amnibacterium kyonggiense]TDS79533.1 LuxR family maltose regulon positive regulatory protein [Amnibacterium kyonggiense]